MRADAPFVDRPIGDDAVARRVAARLAAELGGPSPQLLRAAMNATYECGEVVIRVARPTAPAASAYELADVLVDAGIRVPAPTPGRLVVEESGLAATAWQRVPATGGPVDWRAVGEMVGRLHALDPVTVGRYPTPPASTFPWWRFAAMLDTVRSLVDEDSFAALQAAADRAAGWEEARGGESGWVLCHGDVHHHNVIAGPDGPVLLDWDLLCLAPPEWDHAPLRAMVARWGAEAGWYRDFAAGAADDVDEELAARLTAGRLLAATLLRVVAEGPDRPAGSEASRRLAWWRGDPAAPAWAVV